MGADGGGGASAAATPAEAVRLPIGFEAVLLDLDGTLVATDRFWLPAAQRGSRRALLELGLPLELPTAREWLRIVGLPLGLGIEMLFSRLDTAARRLVELRCEDEERQLLRAGGAALMPGARDALLELRRRGVRLAVASNCGRGYLEQVLGALELGPLIEAARCLESPSARRSGPGSPGGPKGAMVRDLLETLGTRSACFIGDRAGDREAAHSAGIDHVHFAGGFADPDEERGADAVLADWGECTALLERRAQVLADVARDLDLLSARTLAISAEPGTEPAVLASDLGRVLSSLGRPSVWLPIERLGEPGVARTHALTGWLSRDPSQGLVGVYGTDLGGEPALLSADRRLHLVASPASRTRRLADHPTGDISAPSRPAPGAPAARLDLTSALSPRWLP